MSIHDHLIDIIDSSPSASEAMSSAIRAIAEDFDARAAAVYLRGERHLLSLRALFGLFSDERNHVDLASEIAQTVLSTSIRDVARFVVGAPMASRGGAIGAIVVERPSGPTFTAEEMSRLSAIASQMVAFVEAERLIGPAQPSLREERPEPRWGEAVFEGTAASPGLGVGGAAFRQIFPFERLRMEVYAGAQVERDRLRDAVQKTRNDLLRLQSAAALEIGEEQALIFGAHLLFLADSMLHRALESNIAAGQSAAVAVDDSIEGILQRLRDAPEAAVRDRVEDFEDLRARLLGYLVPVGDAQSVRTRVVVAQRITPSVVIELKAQGATGLVSEVGTTTSHGVLLARALGIPAVTGVAGLIDEVAEGNTIIVDGYSGRVIVRPRPETLAQYRELEAEHRKAETEFARFRRARAVSADGVGFRLQANVAFGVDLELARENGAEGIGLYRTEFPFTAREGIPTVEEQCRIYKKAYDAFPEGPIVFRIVDLAGDKIVPGRELGVMRNSFHGYRSIRVLFDHPHILRDQVRAFALASAGRPLRILVPMVTSVEEMVHVRQLVDSALSDVAEPGKAPVRPIMGAMVETPAAVEILSDLAEHVEFFSVGTNDLIQYALVIDREDARMSSPRDPFHPAVLRMIRRIVQSCHACGKPVSVCGELAARPEFAMTLIAMGVDALSVMPRVIPELKQALFNVELRPLADRMQALIATPDQAILERSLRSYLARGGASSGGRGRAGREERGK